MVLLGVVDESYPKDRFIACHFIFVEIKELSQKNGCHPEK